MVPCVTLTTASQVCLPFPPLSASSLVSVWSFEPPDLLSNFHVPWRTPPEGNILRLFPPQLRLSSPLNSPPFPFLTSVFESISFPLRNFSFTVDQLMVLILFTREHSLPDSFPIFPQHWLLFLPCFSIPPGHRLFTFFSTCGLPRTLGFERKDQSPFGCLFSLPLPPFLCHYIPNL